MFSFCHVARPAAWASAMDELSRCAGLSRFRTLRAFQRQVGVAPSVYRRTLRLERANRRLAAGKAPAAVAAALDFVDQSHLTRWFRRAYGITPGQYKRGSFATAGHPT
jgi:AraC-like DNA-binding protein